MPTIAIKNRFKYLDTYIFIFGFLYMCDLCKYLCMCVCNVTHCYLAGNHSASHSAEASSDVSLHPSVTILRSTTLGQCPHVSEVVFQLFMLLQSMRSMNGRSVLTTPLFIHTLVTLVYHMYLCKSVYLLWKCGNAVLHRSTAEQWRHCL